jgi:RNA 3'-terminal phosphate cyclase (ATP)
VFLPQFVKHFCRGQAPVEFRLLKRGFFPRGGGIVEAVVKPVDRLFPCNLTERGDIAAVKGLAYVSPSLPANIAHRMVNTAKKLLSEKVPHRRHAHARGRHLIAACARAQLGPKVPIDISLNEEKGDGQSQGVFLFLMAETTTGCVLGDSELGEKGLSAEEVARRTVASLLEDIEGGGCVDQWLQDQVGPQLSPLQPEDCVHADVVPPRLSSSLSTWRSLTARACCAPGR